MKLRIFGLVILFIFCFGIVSANAEEPKNQMYYVYDIVTCPSKALAFEANLKKIIAEYSKFNWKYPWSTYSTNDFHYYILFAIDNFASMDALNKSGQDLRNEMGPEKYDALYAGYGGTFKYMQNGFYTLRGDLSYISDTPRIKPEELNFLIWNTFYIKTGKEQEAEKNAKNLVNLYRSKKITTGFNLLIGGIGAESPVIVTVSGGKSASDFFNEADKNDKLISKEMADIWKTAFSVSRKFEQKMGRPRPDLSYTPKTE